MVPPTPIALQLMTTPTPPPPPPRPPVPPAADAGATTPTPPPAASPADVPPVEPGAAAGGISSATMALAAIGGVVIVGVAVIGGLAIFGGGDSAATDQSALTTIALRETVVETTLAPIPTTVAVVETTLAPTPETTAAPVTTVAPSTTTAPATTAPPTTVAATVAPAVSVPDSTPSDPNVEESKAVVRGGQIFLTGAVPTAEAGIAIEALAAEILGPQNVFNNYGIDPAAGDPNLGNITVEDTITFASGSAVLQQSSELLLNQGLALLSIRPTMTITIVGHTDDIGDDASNLELSQARAESVKQWFVDRDVDPKRLAALGRGESEPIADNTTDDGRRQNRRIQFFLENILG